MIRSAARPAMLMPAIVTIAILTTASAAGAAGSDELMPVPVMPLQGHGYVGLGEPSQIRFINVRPDPVRVLWIDFAGATRAYSVLAPGDEYVQPTFVTHRWLVADARDGSPLEGFISTRPTAAGGAPQIALIR